MKPLLVVAGNLIVDDVVCQDGTTSLGQAGGAALYAALGAALWGVPVGIVSVVGNDYPKNILTAVSAMGIDLGGVRRVPGPGLRIWLLYEGRRRQVVHHLTSPSHARMSPRLEDLPSTWRPRAYHLAPMPMAIQVDWLDRLGDRSESLLSLDPFDLVDERSVSSMRSLFGGADLVFLSEDELLLESALEAPKRCLARVAPQSGDTRARLAQIFLKRGARGGLVYDRRRRDILPWPERACSVVDSTGAGDAFAGGLLAGLLRGGQLEEALERAVVSASFALESQGATGLLRATPEDCAARWREWFGRNLVA